MPYKCRLLLLLVVVDSSRVHVDGYSTLQLQTGLQSSKGCQPLQSSAADGGHQPRHHQRRSQTPWTTTKLETSQRTTPPAHPPGQPPQVTDLRIKNLVTDPVSNTMKNSTTTTIRSTTSGLGHRLQEDHIRSQTPETAIRSGTLQKVRDSKSVFHDPSESQDARKGICPKPPEHKWLFPRSVRSRKKRPLPGRNHLPPAQQKRTHSLRP